MAVTTTNVHIDIGEVWDGISGTTTTIIGGLITKSEDTIKLLTGTTSGYDLAIRNYADFLAVQNVLGGRDGVSIAIEGVSLGAKELIEMRDKFLDETDKVLKIAGFNFDGVKMLIEQVNN